MTEEEKAMSFLANKKSDYNLTGEELHYYAMCYYMIKGLEKENEMLKEENKVIKKQLNYLRSGEYYNQLKFERNMLQDIVDNGVVSQEDREYIDCTRRNTELLEENNQLKSKLQQLKEELEKNEKMKQEAIELLKDFLCSGYYCSQGKELYDFCSDLGKILGMIKG